MLVSTVQLRCFSRLVSFFHARASTRLKCIHLTLFSFCCGSLQYCVRPNSGRIEPGEKVEVSGKFKRPSLVLLLLVVAPSSHSRGELEYEGAYVLVGLEEL